MAFSCTAHLNPQSINKECMDDLSAFRGAPPELREQETTLLKVARVVFTGGFSLFEAKKKLHPNVYAFPSSIDLAHFAKARIPQPEPADQSAIPNPRIGYYGVIDERMDLGLLEGIAAMRPGWHLAMIGPVVKISEADLPRSRNIHYLGMKSYEELPSYIAGWEAAILPFARTESTRFISPTKTPEYLAAGRPVVSTSIADVIRSYGELGLVHIADHPEDFVEALEKAMREDPVKRMQQVDPVLAQDSWSRTWGRMAELIDDSVASARLSHINILPNRAEPLAFGQTA
jgi:UDP-galactopyranose mutase